MCLVYGGLSSVCVLFLGGLSSECVWFMGFIICVCLVYLQCGEISLMIVYVGCNLKLVNLPLYQGRSVVDLY